MKQWLNEPKNKPIVFGIAGLVMVGAIIFILFQLGVIGGGPQPYTPPPQMANGIQPTGPVVPGPGGPPASPPGVNAPPSGPGTPPPGAPPTASGAAGQASGTQVASAVPAQITAAPGARKDPFAPYVDLTAYFQNILRHHAVPPRVDTFAPALTITTYLPPMQAAPQTNVVVANNPNGSQAASPESAIGRVSGVMLGTGAYAIVDNNGQSSVLQPGDQLPNGAGELMSIQADSITVKVTNGQFVKVPISSGDDTGGQQPGANGMQAPNVNGNS